MPTMLGKALIALVLAVPGVAAAAEYQLAEELEVIGESTVIAARYEDTFVSLARAHNVGFEALRRANPDVDEWLPGEGTLIVIPTQFVLPRAPRRGIVVNVAELRLYYFPDANGRRVITHPISIGRMDWATPLGTTSVVGKVANPSWYPPESIRAEHLERNDPLPRIVPPGPNNPLGAHALRLGLPGYLIHGTNKPSGVGMRVTHGCIRMFPEDIEALYKMVPAGTPVHLVNQPYKLGWGDAGLYLEAHPPLLELPVVAESSTGPENAAPEIAAAQEHAAEQDPRDTERWSATELTRIFVAATEKRRVEVSWESAERVMQAARGIPEFVSIGSVEPVASELPQPLAVDNEPAAL
jgi:L,D-transpeptidase ErfK/SrfK